MAFMSRSKLRKHREHFKKFQTMHMRHFEGADVLKLVHFHEFITNPDKQSITCIDAECSESPNWPGTVKESGVNVEPQRASFPRCLHWRRQRLSQESAGCRSALHPHAASQILNYAKVWFDIPAGCNKIVDHKPFIRNETSELQSQIHRNWSHAIELRSPRNVEYYNEPQYRVLSWFLFNWIR